MAKEIITFPQITLRSYQEDVWNYMMQDSPGLRAVMVWPRRNGKDLVSINIMAAKALQRKGAYAYIAPFATQCRNIIWEGMSGEGRRFIDYIPPSLVERKLDQTMKLWLTNGSTIQLFGSDNPDALVGQNFVGVIFTEYSLHKDSIWHFIRPMLVENGGWALMNGTPRGLNHFYNIAQMARTNPSWFFQHLSAHDTGVPTPEQIEEERQAGMPESLIEQEFYTSFTSSTEETLIPLDSVQKAVQTTLAYEEYSFAPRVIGVDPAYAAKGDKAVIARRQGRKVFPLDKYQGIDPMELASRVAHYIKEWHPHYVFVDAGRGEAVWSRLHQLGYSDRVIPVPFNGKTYDDLYAKKKDQIWGRLKTYICNPTNPPDLPDDEDLIRDLSAPTYELDERGRLVIETKRQLKKRGFSSTDCGDALALTFSEELDEVRPEVALAKQWGVDPVQAHLLAELQVELDKGTTQYDPLSYLEEYDYHAEA